MTADVAEAIPDSRTTPAPLGPPDRLPRWRLLLYALPTLPFMMFILPTSFFVPAFMTGELGLSLTAWAMIALAARVFDIVMDPVLGVMCDRFPSRFGRRRHWLVLATPILMLTCAMLFLPHLFVERISVGYALAAMLLMQVGQTLFSLNGNAWGAELSEDYDERSRIMGWRGVVNSGVAPFVVFGLPALLERIDPAATTGDKLFWQAMVFLPLLPLSTALAVRFVGERPSRAVARPAQARMTFAQSWMAIARNKLMLRLLAIEVLGLLPFAISTAINVFYVTFVLQAPGVTATILICAFAGGLLSMPVWMRLTQRFEKHSMLLVAYLCAPLAVIPQAFLGPGDVVPFAVLVAISGVFSSGPLFIMRALIADVVDTDLLVTGEQRTGTFYALIEMGQKAIPSLAVAMVFPFLQWAGFDPSSNVNTPEAIDALRWTFALFPPVPMLLTALLLWKFPLGRAQHAALRAQIAARHGGG